MPKKKEAFCDDCAYKRRDDGGVRPKWIGGNPSGESFYCGNAKCEFFEATIECVNQCNKKKIV